MTDQEKREKVIEGLEFLRDSLCDWAEVELDVVNDALALLKAQEPIAVVKMSYTKGHGKCPKCDTIVSMHAKFCWHCGQAVKWE